MLYHAIRMGGIRGHGSEAQVSPDIVDGIRRVVDVSLARTSRACLRGLGPAAAFAEARRLAHVDPNAVKFDLAVEVGNLLSPPRPGGGAVPVGPDHVSRPGGADILASVGILHEDVELMAPLLTSLLA